MFLRDKENLILPEYTARSYRVKYDKSIIKEDFELKRGYPDIHVNGK